MDWLLFLNDLDSIVKIVSIALLILAGIAFFFSILGITHGFDKDHDISVEHDMDLDHDINEIDLEHDVEIDKDFDKDGILSLDTRSNAPIIFILFILTFLPGIVGITIFFAPIDNIFWRIFRLLLFIILPLFSLFLSNKIWHKISETTAIHVPKGKELIGMRGDVYVTIDEKSGMIQVDLGKNLGFTKLYAKSYKSYEVYPRGTKIHIVGFKDNTYLVDIYTTTDRPIKNHK